MEEIKYKKDEEVAQWRRSTDAGELMVRKVQELCLRDKVIEDQSEDVEAWRNLSPVEENGKTWSDSEKQGTLESERNEKWLSFSPCHPAPSTMC